MHTRTPCPGLDRYLTVAKYVPSPCETTFFGPQTRPSVRSSQIVIPGHFVDTKAEFMSDSRSCACLTLVCPDVKLYGEPKV